MLSPSLDRALWHLLRERNLSVYTLAVVYLAVAFVLALSCFTVVEKRRRSSWQHVPATSDVAGDGPYRQGVITRFLGKAPRLVRITSFAGILVGTIGLVWPALLVMDLVHGWTRLGAMLAIEALGTALAVLCFSSAVALLGRSPAFARRARAFHILAALLFCSSVAYLLGVFDGVEVMAYGIKWREPMTLGAFTRSGFFGMVDGHMGIAWRVVLRAASLFGILGAASLASSARVSGVSPVSCDSPPGVRRPFGDLSSPEA